jgi:hypothetical protein
MAWPNQRTNHGATKGPGMSEALPLATRHTELVAGRLRYAIRHSSHDAVVLDIDSAAWLLQRLEPGAGE